MVKSRETFIREPLGHNLLRSAGALNQPPTTMRPSTSAIKDINDNSQQGKGFPMSMDVNNSLSALRHDHSTMFSSTIDMMNNSRQQQLQAMPPTSSGVTSMPFTRMNDPNAYVVQCQWDRKTGESTIANNPITKISPTTCLPYGYPYDDMDQDEAIISADCDEGLLSKGFDLDYDKWIMDYEDDEYATMESMNEVSFPSLYSTNTFRSHKDEGPTLAQLNLTDALDFDDFESPSKRYDAFDSRKRQPMMPFHQPYSQSLPSMTPFSQAGSMSGLYSTIKKEVDTSSFDQLPMSSLPTTPTSSLMAPIFVKTEPIDPSQSSQQNQSATQVPPNKMSSPVKAPTTITSPTAKNVTFKEEPKESKRRSPLPIPSTSRGQLPNPLVARVRNTSEGSISSHDEGFASQPEDSDDDDVDDSDDESFYGDYDANDLLGASTSDDKNNKWTLNMGRARKNGQSRFFWQYNVQSKGPKGARISAVGEAAADPHVLHEASDPVFSPECHVEGVKHAGKARRGDGNDLTPNPRKLLMIGLELKKLSKTINDLTPVTDVPVTARNKTRKEKNKLASRACRLKKKAQHEANKIKLFGLQQEHKKTMAVIRDLKKIVKDSYLTKDGSSSPSDTFMTCVDIAQAKHQPIIGVSGRTADFVNSILDNVTDGQVDGGLSKI